MRSVTIVPCARYEVTKSVLFLSFPESGFRTRKGHCGHSFGPRPNWDGTRQKRDLSGCVPARPTPIECPASPAQMRMPSAFRAERLSKSIRTTSEKDRFNA